ncbi:hypothetical protein [Staphylococcus epidermidis]|nr:hypothetical protein [Staphylococcus epidermidis]
MKEGEVEEVEWDIKRIEKWEKLNVGLKNGDEVVSDESGIGDRL